MGKRYPIALLVRMETSADMIKDRTDIPEKYKNRSTI